MGYKTRNKTKERLNYADYSSKYIARISTFINDSVFLKVKLGILLIRDQFSNK